MTDEELKSIIWDDNDNYECIEESIEDTSRWHTFYDKIVKLLSDSTYWRISWSRGSTEYQDEGPENISIVQVFPFETRHIVYLTEKELP